MPAMTTAPRPQARRLDVELVERTLATSRERAQGLVAAGLVDVDGAPARSAAQRVTEASSIRVAGPPHPWVGRGGVKLAAALDAFGVTAQGRVALDAGASTGGFTDVLLARGAARVYAVDVGHGLLDARLAADARVTVMDRTNLRSLRSLPGEPPDLVTLDLSFISLRTVLPAVAALVRRPADVVALFKPQFEVGRDGVGRGGVVRDAALAASALAGFEKWTRAAVGAALPHPALAAPIRGAKGNQEWLVHLRLAEQAA